MRDTILEALETFLEGVFRLGGDGDLSFGKPLKSAPRGLPPGAADVFTTVSRRITMRWTLDEDVGDALPDEFEECRFGELDLHPKCFDAVTDKWSTDDDPIWSGKVVFAPDGSGDYFGIDPRGRVAFLSHDLDEPHGQPLASSLLDLLVRWAPLGCVGPSGAALAPFLTTKNLSPKSAAAKRFIKLIGGQSRDWKAARKARRKTIGGQTKAIAADASGTFETFIRRLTDPKSDKLWGAHHAYVLDMIEKCYGRAPSPALTMLLQHTPGKPVGGFEPKVPGATTTSWSNAFIQAQADVHLLVGALTNTWPIGSKYLAEVDPSSDQVSLRTPLLGFAGVSESLPEFAQKLAIHDARRNTRNAAESTSLRTRAVALAEEATPLRALFEHYATNRHLPRIEPSALPADFASLDSATALRRLWLAYLGGGKLSLEPAKEHPAAFVRDAAEVIESLLGGANVRNPANFLHLAREVSRGAATWPEEHDDEEELVNEAYTKQKEARWDEMLEFADRMIACGSRLDHAWPYRVRALAGLGRHEEVLEAADRALLYCEIGASKLFGAKIDALTALGDREAADAHVWWCSPHYRTTTLGR